MAQEPRSAHPGGTLVGAVRAGLAALGDPARAAPMQAYMKSTMRFRGVPTPERRRLCRGLFKAFPFRSRVEWEESVRLLWDEAQFREERYAAIELTGHASARPWQDVDALPLYEHMIISGAWWDYVDDLAIRRVGPILRTHPDVGDVLRAWAVDDDLWRRRTAIIAQVGSRAATDVDLLTEVVDANLAGSPLTQDFFVRKAIGWALREHAKTDPDWVRAFVRDRRDRLSPLSYREATKHL